MYFNVCCRFTNKFFEYFFLKSYPINIFFHFLLLNNYKLIHPIKPYLNYKLFT